MHQGREVTGSGQYSAVEKFTLARQAEQCIKDERLQVQDNSLLLKNFTLAKAGRTVHQGREVIGSGHSSLLLKN